MYRRHPNKSYFERRLLTDHPINRYHAPVRTDIPAFHQYQPMTRAVCVRFLPDSENTKKSRDCKPW